MEHTNKKILGAGMKTGISCPVCQKGILTGDIIDTANIRKINSHGALMNTLETALGLISILKKGCIDYSQAAGSKGFKTKKVDLFQALAGTTLKQAKQ